MTFDDDLRNRLSGNVSIDDIDAGADAAGSSSSRRTMARRAGAAGAVAVVLLVGLLGIMNLGDDQASDLRTADPDTPTEPVVSDDPTEVPTTEAPSISTPLEADTTAIITVDSAGNVWLNGQLTTGADSTELQTLLDREAETSKDGPGGMTLHSKVGTAAADQCPVNTILDADGEVVDDHPLNRLSRCIPGEIAAWSTAGHVVLATPTEQDAWTITVISADGESAQWTTPGAFQPMQLDVHTDPSGRTQALILGTGEELVYVDVDLFLESEDPGGAIIGISNPTNLVAARFVDGYEQHAWQAQVDLLNNPSLTDEVTDAPADDTPAPVWAVADVAADDTLNARSGPGTDFDIVFEFGPEATGVVGTGEEAISDDGGRWVEVYSPTSGVIDESGWVNAAFLTVSDVADARPCLFNGPQDHYIGIDWTNPDGSASSEAAVISNIETYRFGSCLRTVIEFSDGWSFEDDGPNRVTALPNDIVVTRDELPRIDFGASITGAEVAEARFAERPGVAQSTFVSVGSGRTLDGVLYGPTTTMFATFDNTNGTLVIDISDIRLPVDADPAALDRVGASVKPIIDENGLVLTNLSSTASGRQWNFTGLARPFEANLAVDVRTTNGNPLDVEWVNGVVDGPRSNNGVMTSTWTEAWGQFSFSVIVPDGVDPADVIVVFDPSGGAADDPETIDLRLADWTG